MKHRKNETANIHYYSDRLQHKLNILRISPAGIIEAPSGYGKTTAVRDYLEGCLPQGTAVYWFTAVDEAPEAGFRRLCFEIEKIDGRAGTRLLQIGFPNAVTIGEACDILRSIECGCEAWLVIDNFQFLNAGLPPSFLTALLEHSGAGLHIVIVTQMLGREIHTAIAGRGFLHITVSDLRLEAGDVRRYYALAGADITPEDAQRVVRYTEGWIIAVYLQLRAFQETGVFSDTAIISLMDHLVWERLTEAQQTFLLCLSPFATVTAQQACALACCDALPGYALEALQSPFIRYERAGSRYELHSILSELLAQKRRERGEAFDRQCFMRAGDLCRDNGRNTEALAFYWQIKDFRGMLSLDFSPFIFAETGDTPFAAVALELAQNCPAEIKREYPLSMLRAAWALKAAGLDAAFAVLLDELDLMLEQDGLLRAEWLLLSAYRFYPRLDKMMPLVKKAASLFGGKSSQVILPDAPWCFGDYSQMVVFHRNQGEADREADRLEEFIALYSMLTGGHGSGADALFRAELAHYRGDLSQAEILAYKAIFLAEVNRQSIVQLGAALHLCEIAVEKSDFAGWQSALSSMEHAAACQNNAVVRTVLDTLRGLLLNELKHQDRIADWLKNADQVRLLPAVRNNALFVQISFLMHQGEYARMAGAAQALRQSLRPDTPFGDALLSVLVAVGHVQTGDKTRATENLERALEQAIPDGLVYLFAVYHWLLQGLPEALIGKKCPAYLSRYLEIKERFRKGFDRLHAGLLPDPLPGSLTPREREIALLAAQGFTNSEIAEKLIVTENTVRTHLHSVFQKLDIDRRTKLAARLLNP
ncbi:MAG: LuxR C-terminal-related transcriptional regulator [Peptococcaceae bacterium]